MDVLEQLQIVPPMHRDEWIEAILETQRDPHSHGRSYKKDSLRLVATLEHYYKQFEQIRQSLDRIGVAAEILAVDRILNSVGVRSVSAPSTSNTAE